MLLAIADPRGSAAGPFDPGPAGRSKADEPSRKAIYKLYLAHTRYINNWDLVDASAREIVGGYLADKSRKPLDRLAGSHKPLGAADQHHRNALLHPPA